MSRVLTLLAATLSVAALVLSEPWDSVASRGRHDHHHHRQRDRLGAVSSESRECSQIGVNLLRAGGNAADAMVGTVLCVGTVAPYHSGIGGGGFMLVRAANGSYEFIDFREKAPAAAYRDMYNGNYNGSLYGGLASGVPGELRGLEHLHTNYGRLSWKTAVAPSIELARRGFRVNEDLVSYMSSAISDLGRNFLVDDPAFAIDFAPHGRLLQLNQTIYRKRYADTLESIATYGVDAFYSGAIAKATIAALQAHNGTMTVEDLKNYTVAIREPAEVSYRDYKIRSCSAPSGGEVALSIMNIVSGYKDFGWPETLNISTVRLVEAMKFAYGQRTNLGDPFFVANLNAYQKSMLDSNTGAEIRNKITGRALDLSSYDPKGLESLKGGIVRPFGSETRQNPCTVALSTDLTAVIDHGTSAIIAGDASGLAISLTTTVNTLFGSKVMVPETGVVMNNEMNDFSVPGQENFFGYIDTVKNRIEPNKRPLSSISPTIVEHSANGTLYFALGSAGGSQIITAVVQGLWHVLDQNATSYAALAAPRLHDQLVPETVTVEYAYSNSTISFVREREVNITRKSRATDISALRLLSNGTFEAAAEPNQHNAAAAVV